jgi:regulatory protein
MDVQVTSVIPLEKGKARIRFEDGSEVILYKGEIRKLGIQEGCVITDEVYHKIIDEILGQRAIKRAMHLLERQDRTERQLYDKLKENGYPEVCIESAISYVKRYHYIDDFRYASAYIRYRQEKKSRQKLKLELQAKGIARDVIEEALEEEYVSDDQKKILELLQKRRYSFENADTAEQRKNYQFLLRRGFQSSDILHVMRQEW